MSSLEQLFFEAEEILVGLGLDLETFQVMSLKALVRHKRIPSELTTLGNTAQNEGGAKSEHREQKKQVFERYCEDAFSYILDLPKGKQYTARSAFTEEDWHKIHMRGGKLSGAIDKNLEALGSKRITPKGISPVIYEKL